MPKLSSKVFGVLSCSLLSFTCVKRHQAREEKYEANDQHSCKFRYPTLLLLLEKREQTQSIYILASVSERATVANDHHDVFRRCLRVVPLRRPAASVKRFPLCPTRGHPEEASSVRTTAAPAVLVAAAAYPSSDQLHCEARGLRIPLP